MAIVTISQIKHRRGIKGVDPMPQLASAELGWAVDEQGLYIGNGTISEGAPALGNTEILTEHSNIAGLLSDYTYDGPFNLAVMDTDSGSGAIVRSQALHNDDRVNVRSFGAVGDGVANDLPALNQAIRQHTSDAPVSNRYWTTIYIPAGTYRITTPLQLPSRVRLVGDGYNSTIISMDSGNAAVLEFGEPVDLTPTDIYISGIGFTATQAVSNVCAIEDANNIIFDRVAFNGAQTDTISVPDASSKACVLFSNVDLPTYAIKFLNCLFTNQQYGIASRIDSPGTSRQDISDVVVENCIFDNLYKGIICGPGVDTSTYTFPSNWRVSVSLFDNITAEGIHCHQTSKFTSAMNHFRDVGYLQLSTPLIGAQDEDDYDGVGTNGTFSGGTGYTATDVITLSNGATITVDLVASGVVTEFTVTTAGTTSAKRSIPLTQTAGAGLAFSLTPESANITTTAPTFSNIVFGESVGPLDPTVVSVANYEDNYSIGDTFDRDDTDDAIIERITTNCFNSYVIDPSSIRYGVFTVEPGRLIRLADNTAGVTPTGIALDSDLYHGAIIDYQINRGANVRRIGTLTLVIGEAAAGQSLTEDFVEATTTTGITFSLATTVEGDGDVAIVEFTSTATGADAIFSYSIRHLTCKLAVPAP